MSASHNGGMDTAAGDEGGRGDLAQLVTVFVGGQMFGLPILQVRDVFLVSDLTPVPLAPAAVAGLFNLRGRVMTMLSMRAMLGFPRSDETGTETTAIGIEWGAESFGLLVDKVGEVMALSAGGRDANPINLDRRWAQLSAGVHRLDGQLLVELSLDSLFHDRLNQDPTQEAA
jgi:purine-binding chemotaxis protein CheW